MAPTHRYVIYMYVSIEKAIYEGGAVYNLYRGGG